MKKITFIGAGNMAQSLIAGLIKDETSLSICVADPLEDQLEVISTAWPEVVTHCNNLQAIEDADAVILAVKPQLMQQVCEPLQDAVRQLQPLIISIAAGITEGNLSAWLGGNLGIPVVRCMPNTPALVQAGITGLYANELVSEDQRNLAESILRSVGSTIWFDEEEKLNAVTAVSGSGPAYFFLVMEAMQAAAENLGLSAENAQQLVLQTAFGAAKLALESSDHPAELRRKVTSKGGTTEAALEKLTQGGLIELFDTALLAASQRSEELSK
ncbi:MAG TPA: pyrroline-5-carboxylate reductase [Leucothrix mucor]|nr:pyrroline-5-carboxylate reductase [Leucothrix mucor]